MIGRNSQFLFQITRKSIFDSQNLHKIFLLVSPQVLIITPRLKKITHSAPTDMPWGGTIQKICCKSNNYKIYIKDKKLKAGARIFLVKGTLF